MIGQFYQIITLVVSFIHILLIVIFSIISVMLLDANYKSYSNIYNFDFSLFVLLGIECCINIYCFKKNFFKINNNIQITILLSINILVDILNISYCSKILNKDNSVLNDQEIHLDDIIDMYSSYGFFLMGLHNFINLYYVSIKLPELKIRYYRLKEKRQILRNKKDQEASSHYLIFDKQEQKPLEKACSMVQQFQKRISKTEKETIQDFDFIIRVIKEAITMELSQNMYLEKQLKGTKRIGDREEQQVGQGLYRAKLSNLNDIYKDLNVQDRKKKPQEHISEQEDDDEQQYYSDIQKHMVSNNNLRHSNSSRFNEYQNKEFTVDPIKLSKYLQDYNKGIENCLLKLNTFEFDIFNLRSISSGKELIILGYEIAQRQNLIEANQISKFVYLSFLQGIAQSYNNVAYHSKTHAGDVLQGLHYFLKTGQIAELLKLTPLEHMGAIVAAISHDVDHPGFNNQFLVATKDEIAILYNDQSVLENHHVAQTFLLLRQDELNIFKRFSPANQNKVREIMIKMVLATDMFYHAQNMQQMQRIIEKTQHDPTIEISNNQLLISEEELQQNKIFLLGQSLHLADISNPCREWTVCSRWTDLVFREFFYQGDLERSMNLPISNLMDKKTVNIAQTQVGFINFLVLPVFSEFSKICINLGPLMAKAQQNRKQWEDLKEVFEIYKDAQTKQLNNVIGGMEDDYFSYENYIKRKIKSQGAILSNQNLPISPHHSKLHVSVKLSTNQRLSFLTRKSSYRASNNKLSSGYQESETQTGVFVLKEAVISNESSESVSASQKNTDSLDSPRHLINDKDQILENDHSFDEKKSSILSKSDNAFTLIMKQSSLNQGKNSHRFYMIDETLKDNSQKIGDISISMSKDNLNDESVEKTYRNNTGNSPNIRINNQDINIDRLAISKIVVNNHTLMQRSGIITKKSLSLQD